VVLVVNFYLAVSSNWFYSVGCVFVLGMNT
jgi:hypothetical protein